MAKPRRSPKTAAGSHWLPAADRSALLRAPTGRELRHSTIRFGRLQRRLLSGEDRRDGVLHVGSGLLLRAIAVEGALILQLAFLIEDEAVRRRLGVEQLADPAAVVDEDRVIDAARLGLLAQVGIGPLGF